MSEKIVIHVKQENIMPFWKMLPFFFGFPFRSGPLIVIVCLSLASMLAGFSLGSAGMALRGILLYVGLRYAFNILDLFSQGRFESNSPDNSFFGPERRPAKFGLVIALYISFGLFLGNTLVISRLSVDKAVQAQIVERYNKDHEAELAALNKEREAFAKKYGLDSNNSPAKEEGESASPDEDNANTEPSANVPPSANTAGEAESKDVSSALESGPSQAEILALYRPKLGDPLWFKLLPMWFWLVMLVGSLMLPAAAVVIGLEDRFFKALNPANFLTLSKAMGSAYYVLWVLFLLIVGARQLAISLGHDWPMVVRLPVETAVATYLGMVLFTMIGYALYEFHQELGLDVAVDFDSHRDAGGAEGIARAGSATVAIRQAEPQDPLERKVQALLGEGKVKEAIDEIKDYMRYDRFNPELNTRLHPLYVQLDDQAATVAHGQQWIAALLRAEKPQEAFEAYRKLIGIEPNFTPENADALLPIAEVAFQKREFKTSLSLLRGFDKRFPKHKDIPGVYFLGAKLTSEYLRKHENAIQILRRVLVLFPDHAVAEEAKLYLAVLEKVMGSPVA